MTTKVTVTTHTWPVAVDITGNSNYNSPLRRSYGHSSETRFQRPHCAKYYTVSSSASVTVRELPENATSLDFGGSLGADVDGFDNASANLMPASA